ncbi:sugar ABC transporter substrate-binding protein [Labilibacter marinus]|uniref:sugar ABC transporter substrate-binding protein n=1 Tax=Labilibacter marinus TaxID=1477105 RepID=UPI00082F41C3|nr:substrate-binding domain-containing protein [Labilibacter marinus]
MKGVIKLIVLVLFLVGCSKKEKAKVGFLLPERGRFVTESQYFKERIIELGYEPVIVQTTFDPIDQLNKGHELIDNEDLDLLMIAAINGNTIAPLVRKAKNKDIQVIAYNMLINNVAYDAFLSGDNQHLSNLFFQSAIKDHPEGNYVILGGDAFDRNGDELKKGLERLLKPYVDEQKINIVYKSAIEGWDRNIAMHEFEKVVNAYGDELDVIFTCNDAMADGIIEVLDKYDFDEDVFISGQDAELNGVRNVWAGKQSMTIYHPPKSYAYGAAELVNALLKQKQINKITSEVVYNGKIEVPTVMVKAKLITKENIQEELIDTGVYTMEELVK